MSRLPSVLAVAFAAVVGAALRSLVSFEGGPLHVPDEAVPIHRTTELHFLVRYLFGYLASALFPVASMSRCPTVVDWTDPDESRKAGECMARGRSVERMDEWMAGWFFDEETVFLDRRTERQVEVETDDSVRVTLLRKRGRTWTEPRLPVNTDRNVAPLIFYIHSGGFTTRTSKRTLAARIFRSLLDIDKGREYTIMHDATLAIVDYRLAPEHVYPAPVNDCLQTLSYLVDRMGLGRGGVHVAGVSAGGTLAMETTLKSLGVVDTFFVDVPMVPLLVAGGESRDDAKKEWRLDSPSFRRYAYTRSPPVTWLDWSLLAYTGKEAPQSQPAHGMVTTDVDITGGAMTVSEWTAMRIIADGKGEAIFSKLPSLVLVTARGDPLRDGGLAFKDVYERAVEEAGIGMYGEAAAAIKHFEASSGHCGFYIFEPSLFQTVMEVWYEEMETVYKRKVSMHRYLQ